MARKSKVEHDEKAARGATPSIGLGFLPSALGSGTTGVPTQRIASPNKRVEVSILNQDKESDTSVRSAGKRKDVGSLANRIQKPPRSRSALEVLNATHAKPSCQTPGFQNIDTAETVTEASPKMPSMTVGDILKDAFGTIELRTVYRIENLQLNKDLWASHQARAVESGDIALCAAARTMRRALDIHSGNELRACRFRAKDIDYAAWVNVDTSAVLCVLSPADVYLMGWMKDV